MTIGLPCVSLPDDRHRQTRVFARCRNAPIAWHYSDRHMPLPNSLSSPTMLILGSLAPFSTPIRSPKPNRLRKHTNGHPASSQGCRGQTREVSSKCDFVLHTTATLRSSAPALPPEFKRTADVRASALVKKNKHQMQILLFRSEPSFRRTLSPSAVTSTGTSLRKGGQSFPCPELMPVAQRGQAGCSSIASDPGCECQILPTLYRKSKLHEGSTIAARDRTAVRTRA